MRLTALYSLFLIWLILIVPVTTVQAQQTQNQQQSLQQVLNKIKTAYKVSFVYEQSVVSTGVVSGKLDLTILLETLLNNILPPNGLDHKKIAPGYYSIFRKQKTADTLHTSSQGFSISGKVTDNQGNPLPNATVFLSGSQKITATDNNGNFRLEGLSTGTYELITKMIGFASVDKTVVIGRQNISLSVALTETSTTLEEVQIMTDENRKKYMDTFLRYFIGKSVNSPGCKLLNPEVLTFKYARKEHTLLVTANDFLVLENKGLGYRLKYLLSRFEFNYSNNLVYYSGYPYFEELNGSKSENKRWAKNRAATYNGSIMQFFRAVMDNSLKKEGFEVYSSTKKDDNDAPANQLPIDSLWAIHTINAGLKYTVPQKTIFVFYTRGYDEAYPKFTPGQVSKIIPKTDTVFFDKNGSFSNTGFLFSGYWAEKAIAELLPLDYSNKPAKADSTPLQGVNGSALSITTQIDSFNRHIPAEKVFVQTDKPSYTTADTIWLKSYVLDAALNYSQQSGLLYTELINDTGKVVMRQSMPVRLGISFGQIALDPKVVPEGSYTLRAYTNWMQNQGEQSFFTRQLYISEVNESPWLVNADSKVAVKQGAENLETTLLLTGLDKKPVRLREIQLKIKDGNKTLSKDNLQTGLDGKLDFNLNLPKTINSGRLTILAQDMRKGEGNRTVIVPVTLNRPENTDLQFMPEGGYLVAGLPCLVAFKAIGEDGNGVAVEGNITNGKGVIINQFKAFHSGIGSFELVPEAGETYSAKVTLPNGSIKAYPLPAVKPEGINMHISNTAESDSLLLTITATASILNTPDKYSLIAQSGGKVCYAANLSFTNGVIRGRISKERFCSGITRFTLFNTEQQPIAERLVFIDHHDQLNIGINTDNQTWEIKDSIALHINVTDKDRKPVEGSFSLAVTDDDQVKADSSNTPDIKSYMLLTSDLRGTIEQPGYYFDSRNADKNTALDNLLLTQGWIGYDWKNVFDTKYQSKFKAEPDIEVTGQITRTGGKAIGSLPVTLLSTKKPLLVRDTISDAKGNFVFKNLPRIDTASFMVQVKDKKGRMFEAIVNIDEFTPAPVTNYKPSPLTPWYVNTDNTLLNNAAGNIAMAKIHDSIDYKSNGQRLKEVVIHDKKIVKGSHNLNGAGNADQVMDEQDLIKLKKMSLYELLLSKIKGFNIRTIAASMLGDKPSRGYYAIYEKQVRFVIDGVNIDFFYIPHFRSAVDSLIEFDYLKFEKSVIDLFSAEDIKGVEVLYNNKYTGKYQVTFDSQLAADPIDWNSVPPTFTKTMYVEITTWSGGGPFEKRKSSNALYRPLPVSWPKQFYKPKYTSKGNNTLADLRSTIHWEPNIITDTAGNATVSFYSKSMPGNYTIILQGADLNGSVGYQRKKITVK